MPRPRDVPQDLVVDRGGNAGLTQHLPGGRMPVEERLGCGTFGTARAG